MYCPNMGCDPEGFLLKRGKVFPSDKGILPYQENALKYLAIEEDDSSYSYEDMSLFSDGTQWEMNVTPCTCREYIQDQLWYLLKNLMVVAGDNKLDVAFHSATKVSGAILKGAGKRSFESGCRPDFDAYRMGINNEPIAKFSTHPWRYAGGHIHVSLEDYHKEVMCDCNADMCETVKVFDRIVGLAGVMLSHDKGEIQRRKHYGRAGCFRRGKGRFEYRTLSCFWMKAPELCSLMFGLARVAYNVAMSASDRKGILLEIGDKEIQEAINKCDVELAIKLWERAKLFAYIGDCEESPVSLEEYRCDRISDETIIPAAMFEWVAKYGNYKFSDDIEKEWRLNEKFCEHGETAKGWCKGMLERLGGDSDYKKFQKGWAKQNG